MEAEIGYSKSKMEEYEVLGQIGRGAFGASFLLLHKTENKKYVLKKIRISKQSEKFKRSAHQEMNLIAKLHHPYIVEYKDAWVDKGSCICIVTNYCEGGNISEMLRKARGAYFPEEKLCKWLTQLLLAIDYLHSNRVLHRDLKLSNIFVTKENDIHLGDFGLAKLHNEEALASSVVGTPNYMCPEILAEMPYCYKSDIWSLGCCMFEIAAHQQAFRAPDMAGLINKINKCLISPLPIVYSSTLKQIIKSMLRKNPEHRPTAAELLRHPHLKPFLLRCHNPSTVFLPVKSPSPSTKEKVKMVSPSSSDGGKDYKKGEAKPKQRELRPLFEENSNMQYMSLLDDFVLMEEKLETKRVDPTSYSGQISRDSEDSKTGDTSCERTACNGDNQDNLDSLLLKKSNGAMDPLALQSNKLSKEQQKYSPEHATNLDDTIWESEKTTDVEPISTPQVTKDTELKANDTVRSVKVVSFVEHKMPSTKETLISKVDKEPTSSLSEEDVTGVFSGAPRDESLTEPMNQARLFDQLLNTTPAAGSGESKGECENPKQQRADALESLLELCARLLKQDKFDELSGVLKPFGDDAVSSRETAIWLKKSLMSAQKLAKEE